MRLDFSIVLPAYNDAGLFRRTLESVRCQRDVSMEIIIVDDSNRNDDIEQYVASLHDTRICYRHNHPSLGAVRNWNSGLSLCHGDNIMVVHHDESLAGDTFLMEVKRQLREYDVVVCNIEVHNAEGRVYHLYDNRTKRFAIHHPSVLFATNDIGPCAVIAARKDVMEMFDERINWFVDVEWYYRLMKGHRVKYLPSAIIMSNHGHTGQITGTIDTMAAAKKDAIWLRQKYSSSMAIRIAMWMQIYILHNRMVHGLLKKIAGR